VPQGLADDDPRLIALMTMTMTMTMPAA